MVRTFKVLVPAHILALLLSDTVIILGCYIAAVYLDPDVDPFTFLLYEMGIQRILLVSVILMAGMYISDLYADLRIRSRLLLLQQICFVIGAAFLSEALMGYWAPDWTIPKKVMLIGSLLVLAVLYGWRMLFNFAMSNTIGTRRVLFVGCSPIATELASFLDRHSEFALTPIGYVLPRCEAAQPAGKVFRSDSLSELLTTVDDTNPNWIVIDRPERIEPRWVEAFLELNFGGIQTELVSHLYEETMGRLCLSELPPAEMTFHDLRPSAVMRNIQLLASMVAAAVLGVLCFPLAILIAIGLKLFTKGPVLVRHRFAGLDGDPFTMYQFACKHEVNGELVPTWLGRWLRKSRLDSLPSLINVMKGDLSLIGPEPVRVEFAEILEQRTVLSRERNNVKPGLIGWAQLSTALLPGLPDEVIRLEYDLYYLKHISVSLDLFIIVRSLKALIYGRRALDCG